MICCVEFGDRVILNKNDCLQFYKISKIYINEFPEKFEKSSKAEKKCSWVGRFSSFGLITFSTPLHGNILYFVIQFINKTVE